MNINQHILNVYRDLKTEWHEFQWSSLQTQSAFKTALACIIALWLALLLRVEDPYWAGISALMVSKLQIGPTLQRSFYRAAGTIIGALVAVGTVSLLLDDSILFIIVLFLFVTFGLYKTTQSSYSYAWLLGVVTFLMVTVEVLVDQRQVINTAFMRTFDVLLGIFSASVISTILFPTYSSKDLNQAINNSFLKFDTLLRIFFKDYEENHYDFNLFYTEYRSLTKSLDKQYELNSFVIYENVRINEEMTLMINSYSMFQIASELLLTTYEHILPSEIIKDSFSKNWNTIYNALNECILKANLLINNKAKKEEFEICLRDFQFVITSFKKQLEEHKTKRISPDSSKEIMHHLQQIILCLEGVGNSLRLLSYQPLKKRKVSRKQKFSKLINSFWPTDIHSIKFGIKGAIATLTVPILWVWFDLPGLNQIAISVVAILQMDMVSTQKKGALRIYGCIVGAIVSLAVLGLDIENIILFLLLSFIILFSFNYIHFGRSSIGYFGTQATFAFLIGTITLAYPTSLLSPALERLAGILIGVTITVLINQTLWPFTAKNAYQQLKKKLLKKFSFILSSIHDSLHNYSTYTLSFVEMSDIFSDARKYIIGISNLMTDDSIFAMRIKNNFETLRLLYHDLNILLIMVKFFFTEDKDNIYHTKFQEILDPMFITLKTSLRPDLNWDEAQNLIYLLQKHESTISNLIDTYQLDKKEYSTFNLLIFVLIKNVIVDFQKWLATIKK